MEKCDRHSRQTLINYFAAICEHFHHTKQKNQELFTYIVYIILNIDPVGLPILHHCHAETQSAHDETTLMALMKLSEGTATAQHRRNMCVAFNRRLAIT